jgi:hypothetical protein
MFYYIKSIGFTVKFDGAKYIASIGNQLIVEDLLSSLIDKLQDQDVLEDNYWMRDYHAVI